jgi:HEAT repeat protein
MGFFNHIDIDNLIAEKDIPGLEKCLNTGDKTEQFEAAEALIKFNNWKGFAFLVIELQNNKPSVRAAAAEALGSLRDERFVRPLSRLVKDEDPDVQQAVIDALHAINSTEALDALVGMNSEFIPETVNFEEGHTPNSSFNDAIFGGGSQVEPSQLVTTSSMELKQMAEKYYILASKYYDEDRFTKALTEVNHALELNPKWAEASNLKGLILDELGEQYLALVAYQKAAQLDEHFSDACENLSNLIAELEIQSTPLKDLLDGSTSDDWDMRRDAVASLAVRPEPEAMQGILNALYDEDLEVRVTALEVLEYSQDAAAVEAVEKYYSEFQGEEDDEEGEGQPEVEQRKELIQQRTLMETVQETKPINLPKHKSTREYADASTELVDKDEYSQAYIQSQLALLADPFNADAYNLLGIIHEENDEFRQAYFDYKKAVSCEPSYEEARSNLEEIIREFGEANTNFATLVADLESGEDDLIYDAVVNLGELNNEAAIEPLMAFLSKPKRIIVLAAIRSLENLHAKEAVESIASIFNDLWFFPIPPYKMTLDQLEKSRAQSLNDWADRCKIILALGRLGATDWLVRLLEREFDHIKNLSQAFREVGVDDFDIINQVTLDLATFLFEKFFREQGSKHLDQGKSKNLNFSREILAILSSM